MTTEDGGAGHPALTVPPDGGQIAARLRIEMDALANRMIVNDGRGDNAEPDARLGAAQLQN